MLDGNRIMIKKNNNKIKNLIEQHKRLKKDEKLKNDNFFQLVLEVQILNYMPIELIGQV